MPLYTAKSSNLELIGPILDIHIGPSRPALQAMAKAVAQSSGVGSPYPVTSVNATGAAPVRVAAMIDTGATQSILKTGVAQQLGLNPVGIQKINTPTSQNVQCARYFIEITFPSTAGLKIPVNFGLVVAEAPLIGQNIQCLLGRDFLSHGILVYTGPDGSFSFSI